jgi:CRP/FNR family cyclic AMP-dependent transcriptional regulator
MTSSLDVISSLSIFSGLSKSELKKVARLSTQSSIAAGKEFITEGTKGSEAYIIIDGRATVRRKGRIVAGVKAGDIVGEMAVVAGIERTASVTADTDMKVEVMSRREFTSLLDEFPGIARKMLVGALTRIHELEPSIG